MLMEERKEYKPSVVAIDTNLVSMLSGINSSFLPEFRDRYEYRENCRDMIRMVEAGLLKLVILPKTFSEIDFIHYPEESEFVRKYCYVYQPENEKSFAIKSSKLARRLMKEGIMDSDINGKPDADAITISEAINAGVSFITLNIRHFIDYEDERKVKGNERRYDLESFIRRNGLTITNSNNLEMTPTVCTPLDFLTQFKSGLFVVSDEIYNSIDEADVAMYDDKAITLWWGFYEIIFMFKF